MTETYQRIEGRTMSLVRQFAEQFGCSVEVALKFLLKTGRYPQEPGEDDQTYAARLERIPDPDVVEYETCQVANDA